jgi:hypothetical protein
MEANGGAGAFEHGTAQVDVHASTLADAAVFAPNEVVIDGASAPSGARLILVDSAELACQRARCREQRHLLAPADGGLVDANTLQHWTVAALARVSGRRAGVRLSMNGSEPSTPFEERHFTIRELSRMWRFSAEFVRQIVKDEPGVPEWVRQQPGRCRYRALRVPESVAERLYRRAQTRAAEIQTDPRLAASQSGRPATGDGPASGKDQSGRRREVGVVRTASVRYTGCRGASRADTFDDPRRTHRASYLP